jgi:hypothetical protein
MEAKSFLITKMQSMYQIQMKHETTFDGYTAIQEANSSASRDDELEKMRQMRMRNRIKSSDLDNLFQL